MRSLEGKGRDLAPAVEVSWDRWVGLRCVGQEWRGLPSCGWKGGSEGLEPSRLYFSHLSTKHSSFGSKPEEKLAELETVGYCG